MIEWPMERFELYAAKLYGPADRPPSCPLLEVQLPRQPVTGEAGFDSKRTYVHSAICSPDPPNCDGKSLNFGRLSRIGRTVSA